MGEPFCILYSVFAKLHSLRDAAVMYLMENDQTTKLPNKSFSILTTVTPFSKILTVILFVTLPFVGFYIGMRYQRAINVATPIIQTPIVNPPKLSLKPTSSGPQLQPDFTDNQGGLYHIKKILGDINNPGIFEEPFDEAINTYQLWRIDNQPRPMLLYQIVNWFGFSFDVSSDGKYIAITNWGESMGDETFTLVDNQGKKLRDYAGFNAPFHRVPLGWSRHDYWMGVGDIPRTAFIKVNAENLSVHTYDVNALKLVSDDYAFNLDTGKLAYSDYPEWTDNGTKQTTQALQQRNLLVHLYLYDLESRTNIHIATASAKSFNPKWQDGMLEYNSPTGSGRLRDFLRDTY